jgi:hypothetical protein
MKAISPASSTPTSPPLASITLEDASSHGRLDMAVRFNQQIYLFEF